MVPCFLLWTFSLHLSSVGKRGGKVRFLRDEKEDDDLEDIFDDDDFDEQKEAAGWVVGVSRCKNRLCPLGECPSGRLVRRRCARCALRCRRIDDGLFLLIIIILLRVRREPKRARAVVRDENAEHRARRRVQSESWMANGVFGDVCETDASGLSISFSQAKSRGSRRNVEEEEEVAEGVQ